MEEAGTDKSKLLTSTVWIKDLAADFEAFNEVWIDWVDPNAIVLIPVRATTEATLIKPEWLIEIQVSAVIDEDDDMTVSTMLRK